jgi:hypothetical protein
MATCHAAVTIFLGGLWNRMIMAIGHPSHFLRRLHDHTDIHLSMGTFRDAIGSPYRTDGQDGNQKHCKDSPATHTDDFTQNIAGRQVNLKTVEG